MRLFSPLLLLVLRRLLLLPALGLLFFLLFFWVWVLRIQLLLNHLGFVAIVVVAVSFRVFVFLLDGLYHLDRLFLLLLRRFLLHRLFGLRQLF